MKKRFGHVEKFILLDMLTSGRGKDRTQILYALHVTLTGNISSSFRYNVKSALDDKAYSRLQGAVTRAANRLVAAGLVEVLVRGDEPTRHRNWVRGRTIHFNLTHEGWRQAKLLAQKAGLDPAALNRERVGAALKRGKADSR